MLSSFWVSVPFRQAKINYVNNILFLAVANEEVVRFHVPVNKVIVMQKFKPLDHLVSDHQRGLHGEFALAEIKSVLETRPEQIHDHCVVVSLHAKPMNSWNSS